MFKSIIVILSVVFALAPTATVYRPISETAEPPRYGASFQGGNFSHNEDATIKYARKEVDSYENPYKAPHFPAGELNACVVEAGGNAMVYYDRLYDDLVPNYKHTYIWGKFTYGTFNDAIANMFSDLYDLMGCSTQGTSVNGFKTGLSAYGKKYNHTVSCVSAAGSFYGLNYDYLKKQLQQEKMAVVFVKGFSFVDYIFLADESGQEDYEYMILTGRHSVLVYGYKDIRYYDEKDNLIAYNSYLYVSTGYQHPSTAYLSINAHTDIEDAYIVNVQ